MQSSGDRNLQEHKERAQKKESGHGVRKAVVLDESGRSLRLLLEKEGFQRSLTPSKPDKKAEEDRLDRFLVLARLSSGSACYTVNLKDGGSAAREGFRVCCCVVTKFSHTCPHTQQPAKHSPPFRELMFRSAVPLSSPAYVWFWLLELLGM